MTHPQPAADRLNDMEPESIVGFDANGIFVGRGTRNPDGTWTVQLPRWFPTPCKDRSFAEHVLKVQGAVRIKKESAVK